VFSETIFKRQITLDKNNSDPGYLEQSIRKEFPELCSAKFGLWLCRKDLAADMEEIPEHINNVQALCNQQKQKSCVYIRPKVRVETGSETMHQ